MELETQVLIAERLCNTDPETAVEVLRDAAERGKILNGLLSSLQ